MMLSAHQPVYLPGIIFFNKVSQSDTFVLLSDAQFERSSWQMRNKVRSGETDCYISIPVQKKGKLGQLINDTKISGDGWKTKHLKTIKFNYSKRPFFDDYFPELEHIITEARDSVCDLNVSLIRHLCSCLDIKTHIIDSSDLNVSGFQTDRLVSICKALDANEYVSNIGARSYIDESLFEKAGIRHFWQDFHHPVYDQGRAFCPNLSVIDLLFNMGQQAADIVKTCSQLVPYVPTTTLGVSA